VKLGKFNINKNENILTVSRKRRVKGGQSKGDSYRLKNVVDSTI